MTDFLYVRHYKRKYQKGFITMWELKRLQTIDIITIEELRAILGKDYIYLQPKKKKPKYKNKKK